MLENNLSHRKDDTIDRIENERIRQARWAFNLAASFAPIITGFTLTSCVLLMTGHIDKGVYTLASTTTIGGYCMKIYRDANDRLDRQRDAKHKE